MMSTHVAKAFWLIPLAVALTFLIRQVESSRSHSDDSNSLPTMPSLVEPVLSQKSDPNEADTLQSLQAEIQALEERVKKREQVLAQRKKEPHFTQTSSLNQGLDPDQWSNKGYGTPYESMETLIFSAASGDLPTMIDSLVFSPETEALAKRLFERLPASVRQEQGTAETLVAMMTVDRVPLTHAKVTAVKAITDEAREVFMVFSSNRESPQPVTLDLVQLPDTSWKVLVPPEAIHEYAKRLGIELSIKTPKQ